MAKTDNEESIMSEAQAAIEKLAIDELHMQALITEIQHCLICHRKLTNKKSIERRIGDICHTKFNKGYRGIQSTIGGTN
jgi:hypothetical protein